MLLRPAGGHTLKVIQTEKLANWYLRFNGYLTTPNFTVHPDTKQSPEAEADILAVRFPFSEEKPGPFCFERSEVLALPEDSTRIDFLIVEVKSSKCGLNNPWKDPDRHNVEYALRWMGFSAETAAIQTVAESIYATGEANTAKHWVRFVCFGEERNEELQNQYPGLVQIELLHAVEFLARRLDTGCAALHRENWDAYVIGFVKRIHRGASMNELVDWTRGRGK